MDDVSRLRELVDSVQDDPAAVRRAALAVLGESNRPEAVSLANWALGLAARELHDLDEADRRLRAAADVAHQAGLESIEGEILSSHALVHVHLGDVDAAIEALDQADRALTGGAAARNQMQRALIMTRVGDLGGALELYERALPVIVEVGDETAEVRLRLNRSVVHIWQGSDEAATADLERALEIARRRGQSLQVAACAQNLGFVRGRMGDVPAALALFTEAESAYRELGDESGRVAVVLKDRAEVLAEAGLLRDALDDVVTSVEMLERSGNVLDAAEARLTAARLAALAEDSYRSLDDASVAGRAFEAQGRTDWALQADLVAYASTVELGQGTFEHGRKLADRLDARGWSLEAQEARLSAAKTAIRDGRVEAGLDVLEAASVSPTNAVQRIQAHQARAIAHAASGDGAAARAEVRHGLEQLDRHRATLGSIELRARVAARARDLITLGLDLALQGGDPLDVLTTVESWRAASLRFPPARAPEDAVLAEDLARIRALDGEMREALASGEPTDGILRRRSELETRIRRRSMAARGQGNPEHTDVEEGLGRLGDRTLAAFFVHAGRLGAVTVDAGGARLVDVADAGSVADRTRSLVFSLHRMAAAVGSDASQAAAAAAFDDEVGELGSLLVPDGDGPLVVIPTGVLHRLPWQALNPSRSTTVVPSLGSWTKADRNRRPADPNSTALLVAGPDLPGGDSEVRALEERWPNSLRLSGPDATVAAVLDGFEPGDVAHLAAHGEFRADNPLFSSIRLTDGPLTVYDLERVAAFPSTVVLPSCDIALSEVSRGDELLGFTAALFALGVSGVVAPVVPIPDRATTPLMLALHDQIRSGEPVGPALTAALASVESSTLAERAVAAAFVAFGS